MAADKENMSTAAEEIERSEVNTEVDHHHHYYAGGLEVLPIEEEAVTNVVHINLTWRSWFVVFLSCFAIMSQICVAVAAGSVIAFIVRDLGDGAIAGWIIQGPLLMQSVLSPLLGRLSDILDRKYLAAVPPLIAFAGSVISAKATSMNMLIGGGVLIGCTLATIAIVQSIPSEILPLKYRAVANGMAFVAGALGGLIGGLGGGAVTNLGVDGWRWIFWIQAGLHGLTAIGLFCFYWPAKPEYPRMSLKGYIWACDPIGSVLFVCSTTLLLLGLDWAGGEYAWSSPYVAAPLTIGLVLLVGFGLYEWKGRDDGLVAHIFFHKNANFALSLFAFAVEGWIFYSAVNSIVPQMVLNLGYETNSLKISVRQLSFNLVTLFSSIPVTWYATRYKDLKTPLLATFGVFLVVTICYATIQPSWNTAQIIFNVLSGIGQCGPLTLIVACVQFTAPHAFLSTATGLAFSIRSIGGAFGSAVLDAIINGQLAAHYAPAVGAAATAAGLPASSIEALLGALAIGDIGPAAEVPGATDAVWAATLDASHIQYAKAYRLAWASVIPFVVLAIVAIFFLRGVEELMTDKVEATVERSESTERLEKGSDN